MLKLPVHKNALTQSKKNLGEAILLEKVRDGLPYIIEEDIVHRQDVWLCLILDTLEIREALIEQVYKESHVDSKYDIRPKKGRNNLTDKFLKVNGKEIF